MVLVLIVSLVASNVVAQSGSSSGGTIYRLNPDSSFEQGCFPPCLCPVMVDVPVKGTFVLTPTGFDGLFNNYAVDDVRWTVPLDGTNTLVTGKGTYKVGGEVAVQQELSLYLQIDGGTVSHFDSGLVLEQVPFPEINVTVSTNGQVCFDTVFGVSASPVQLTMVRSGANVILLWPTNSAGIHLQCSGELGASAVWSNAPAPEVVKDQYVTTNAISGTQQFFRLSP